MVRSYRDIVLTLAVFSAACATSRSSVSTPTPVLSSGTAYLVSGSTSRGRLDAEVMFSETGAVTIAGSVGCGTGVLGESTTINGHTYPRYRLPPYMISQGRNRIRLECPTTRLTFERGWDGSLQATAAMLEKVMGTRDGPCEEWAIDPKTGRRLGCIRRESIEIVVRSAWSSEVQLAVSTRRDTGKE